MHLRLLILALLSPSLASADWTMPLEFRAENDHSVQLAFGIRLGATSGFDPRLDVPASPYDSAADKLYAGFESAGRSLTQDNRDKLPQDFRVQVISRYPVELSWPTGGWPPLTTFELIDPTSGRIIDMANVSQHEINPGGNAPQTLVIKVREAADAPPEAPSGVNLELLEDALLVVWSQNPEPGLVGYRVHIGAQSENYSTVIDAGRETNYRISNPDSGRRYYVAVSAYDRLGRESPLSEERSLNLVVEEESKTDEQVSENFDVKVDSFRAAGDGRRRMPTEMAHNPRRPPPRLPHGDRQPNIFHQEDIKDGKPLHRLVLDKYPWKLMSIPLKVFSQQPFHEFAAVNAELQLIGWDAEKQDYCKLAQIKPGFGFLLRAGRGMASVVGDPLPAVPVRIHLAKGWNLIGNPFLKTLLLGDVQVQGQDYLSSVVSAIDGGVLSGAIYAYIEGEIKPLQMQESTPLLPWNGYWLEAFQPCELVLHGSSVEDGVGRETHAHFAEAAGNPRLNSP